MDYLCLAVQRRVTRSETGSREQAQEYFCEKFGNRVKAKLEEEKKKLAGRIHYYDRKVEKYGEAREEYLRRREKVWEKLECVENQLRGEEKQFLVWKYEEKYESCLKISDRPDFGQAVLMLCMAKICHTGNRYQVVEETYSYMAWREAGDRGILEVRGRIPEDEGKSWMCLDICREAQETAQRLHRKIKKIGTEARRRFCAKKDGGVYERKGENAAA